MIMTDKEKIRAEIERRRDIVNNAALQMKDVEKKNHYLKMVEEYDDILRFIDSSKEPVSEDLNKEIKIWKDYYAGKNNPIQRELIKQVAYHFANWQKEQILKRLCNHVNIDQMVEKFEDKYKPERVLDTEYYKRGIFDTIKAIKEN